VERAIDADAGRGAGQGDGNGQHAASRQAGRQRHIDLIEAGVLRRRE